MDQHPEMNQHEGGKAEPGSGAGGVAGTGVGGADGVVAGGPRDGMVTGGSPHVFSDVEVDEMDTRGLRYAMDRLDELETELWTAEGAVDVRENDLQLFWRFVSQIRNVASVLGFSLFARLEQANGPLSWVLLEVARRQLGFASITAGQIQGVREKSDDEGHASTLTMLLRRELIAAPRSLTELVDLGAGPEVVPDMRPDTAFESMALECYAFTVQACASVSLSESEPYPRRRVEQAGYREILARVIEETAELLGERARAAGCGRVEAKAAIASDAVDVLLSTGLEPEMVFGPDEGLPGAA